MKIGKSYTLVEFRDWTRRKLYVLLVLAIVPVVRYQVVGLKWIAMPWAVAALLPFCLVREFDRLNESVSGVLAGHMAWLAIPFCVLIAWMYVSLDQVGESTENPFEGGANDVSISQICRLIEIELRELLGETALPPLLRPEKDIIL